VYHERVDVTDAVKLANEPIPPCTGPEIGHSVWFKTTPARAGRLTATTCNSMTNYDTVLAIYQSGGDGVLLEVGCNDDDPRAACVNSCDPAPRAAAVTADVDPNQEYLIQVGAYNNNSAGCLSPLCLGLDVILEDICDIDLTPPEVALVTPPELSAGCVCPAAPIGGWAYDPDGTFDTWTLEYRAIGAEVWSPIGSGGEAPQPGTTLANWNAGGLSQGYYVLRLTARNICSRTSSAERVVWLDTGFDTVQAATSGGSIVGGTACLAGTVADNFCFSQYQAEYSPAGAGTWQPVDPSNPTYGAGVINGQLAAWNTTALPDGNYDLRIMGTTDCAETQSIIFPAAIDNTPPITLISAPGDCDSLSGTVQIVGTVDDANLTGWSLSFTGGGLNQWVPLSSGFAPVIGGLLAEWDVTGLPPCSYTLRLIASDAAAVHCTGETHNRSEFMVSVEVASPLECLADLNGDGLVNLIDFALLQISFGQPCP